MTPVETLTTALRERNLTYNRNAIASTFDAAHDPDGASAEWVTNHVHNDTLLTREEALLLDKLEQSGQLESLLRHPGLETTRVLTEDEIAAATKALRADTETLRKRTEILKTQHEITRKARSEEQGTRREQGKEIEALRSRFGRERQRLAVAADDLEHEITTRLSALKEQAQAEKRQTFQAVASKLKNDDRRLAAAESLAADLESSREDGLLLQRAGELAGTLAQLRSEEIYTRLDRIYLESLSESSSTGQPAEEEISLLEQDLDSLYPEIEVLAQMAARQQYEQPIICEVQRGRQEMTQSIEEKFGLILDLIADMTQSTEETTLRLRSRQSYRETLDRIARLYKREIHSRPESSTPRKAHRRHSSMPAQLSPRPSPRPASTLPSKQDQFQATTTFLRRLGLSLPLDPAMAYQVASEKKREQDQLLHHLATAAQTMALSEPLQKTDQAAELLWTALHSSSDSRPSLTDGAQRERLAELEKRLAALQRGIEGVDLEAASRRDRVKEKFLERWAHR